MVKCKLCGSNFKIITNTHLASTHKTNLKSYSRKFGNKNCGFAVCSNLLPKKDRRYVKWRKSLKRRPPPWSAGFTKENHPSLAKLSETFKEKKIDNFKNWRKKINYPPLKRNSELAFLIGLVLGDGHIQKFPRTEALTLVLGTDKPKLWKHAVKTVRKVFKKKPYVQKAKSSECIRIRIYQKNISKRLGIPTGNRLKVKNIIPSWINNNRAFLVFYLKGLFEAEGSLSIHLLTYTYNLSFSNTNRYLLDIVEQKLSDLGFHPERRLKAVRLRRQSEVVAFEKLISFRKYSKIQ